MDEVRIARLRDAALTAASGSYPRYSGFEVVAAVERVDGNVYGGANVEVVNFSLTKHAEEAAALAAIADDALRLDDKWLTAPVESSFFAISSARSINGELPRGFVSTRHSGYSPGPTSQPYICDGRPATSTGDG